MNTIIGDIVHAIAEKREKWQIEHEIVMKQYDLAAALSEVAALLIHVYLRIEKSCLLGPREKIHKLTLSWGEDRCKSYEFWYTVTADILGDIENSEKEDFPVEGASELRDAFQKVGLMLPAMRKLRRRIADLRSGKCISLKDALNGLGTRVRSEGCETA